jgi:Tol biopolymer transport system component
VSELTATNTIIVDAFLSDDGLTLLYTWAPGGKKPDIYIASRASTTDRFSLAAPIADINSPDDERDPWLSPDGTTFFFTSDRTGTLQIYEATAMRQMR